MGIPGTESSENPRGLMVEVYWEQDDTGSLCISDHSDMTPVPPNVQFTANRVSPRASRGRTPMGYVIDPNQIIGAR